MESSNTLINGHWYSYYIMKYVIIQHITVYITQSSIITCNILKYFIFSEENVYILQNCFVYNITVNTWVELGESISELLCKYIGKIKRGLGQHCFNFTAPVWCLFQESHRKVCVIIACAVLVKSALKGFVLLTNIHGADKVSTAKCVHPFQMHVLE